MLKAVHGLAGLERRLLMKNARAYLFRYVDKSCKECFLGLGLGEEHRAELLLLVAVAVIRAKTFDGVTDLKHSEVIRITAVFLNEIKNGGYH